MEQLSRTDIIWGLAILAGFAGMILHIILQHRVIIAQHGDLSALAVSLTEAVKEANSNTKALDLLEPFATRVVPVELVRGFNAGADLIKTLTPDQFDAFIDQLKLFVKKATDNLPNAPEVPPGTTITTTTETTSTTETPPAIDPAMQAARRPDGTADAQARSKWGEPPFDIPPDSAARG